MDLTIGLIALAILIILSGMFSGVEAAFLALSNLSIRRLVKAKKKNAEIVKELKDDSHKLIITLLIGNNVVNIGASAIATALAIDMFGSGGIGIATGMMTFLILVFGEIIPKSKAMQHSRWICLAVARPLKILKIILYPLVVSFDFITKKLSGSGEEMEKPLITEEELKSFVEIGEETGEIEKDEKEMIHNIFKLNDIEIREVMTPKINMISLSGNKTLGETADFMVKSRHSRIPIFLDNPDTITGILHVRDTLSYIKDQNYDVLLKDIAREPSIIPETKLADDLLHEMQKKRTHIAIVVDEYGVVAGLVTIEDILEEIVGEIYDETDLIEANIKKIDKQSARVKGETSIEELNKVMNTDIEMTNGFDTISGYVLKKLGRIPKEGEEVELEELNVTIEKVKDNRISQVKVIKK